MSQSTARKMRREAEKKKLQFDDNLIEALKELKDTVDKPKTGDITLYAANGATIRSKDVQVLHYDGWKIGYQFKDLGNFMFARRVGLVSPQPMSTIPESEREPYLNSVISVFMVPGAEVPKINITEKGIMFVQRFMAMIPVELNPGVVTQDISKIQQ